MVFSLIQSTTCRLQPYLTAIIAVLTQVVQEQQQQLAMLHEELAVLKARVSSAVP